MGQGLLSNELLSRASIFGGISGGNKVTNGKIFVPYSSYVTITVDFKVRIAYVLNQAISVSDFLTGFPIHIKGSGQYDVNITGDNTFTVHNISDEAQYIDWWAEGV